MNKTSSFNKEESLSVEELIKRIYDDLSKDEHSRGLRQEDIEMLRKIILRVEEEGFQAIHLALMETDLIYFMRDW